MTVTLLTSIFWLYVLFTAVPRLRSKQALPPRSLWITRALPTGVFAVNLAVAVAVLWYGKEDETGMGFIVMAGLVLALGAFAVLRRE